MMTLSQGLTMTLLVFGLSAIRVSSAADGTTSHNKPQVGAENAERNRQGTVVADSRNSRDRTRSTATAGASIIDGTVYVDGQEVPADARQFKSPRTGDVYLIDRRGDAVVVTSESRATRDTGRPATVNVEARSTRGATVNAGKAVVITGE